MKSTLTVNRGEGLDLGAIPGKVAAPIVSSRIKQSG